MNFPQISRRTHVITLNSHPQLRKAIEKMNTGGLTGRESKKEDEEKKHLGLNEEIAGVSEPETQSEDELDVPDAKPGGSKLPV